MGLFGKRKEKDALLHCPRDDAEMEKKTREGITIDKCPKCDGLWLDKGEMENLIKKFEAHQKKLAQEKK